MYRPGRGVRVHRHNISTPRLLGHCSARYMPRHTHLIDNARYGYYPCTGMDEGGGVHRQYEERVDGYCLRTGVDDSGMMNR